MLLGEDLALLNFVKQKSKCNFKDNMEELSMLDKSKLGLEDLPEFISTINMPLSIRQRRVMEVIDSEDYAPVLKKVIHEYKQQGKTVGPEFLAEGILALKQYYAICFMDDNAHAISDALDIFWHAHILHTVPYHRFSERLGIGYMHHAPNDPENMEETQALRVLYAHTQEVFEKCFNWVSDKFNPRGVTNESLLCSHYTQFSFVLDGDNAFPSLPRIKEAEMIFLKSRQLIH